MPRVEMLCLANSWKLGGRCVAGLVTNGSWVRPVTDTRDGELPLDACKLDNGRQAEPLDVVSLKLKRHKPRPYQPENWIIGSKQWRFVESRTISDAHQLLDDACADESPIFGTRSDKVPWTHIQEAPPDASLALVKAWCPRFYTRRKSNGSSQTRVQFVHGDVEYDLSVSFEFTLPLHIPRDYESSTGWYLTISLGEPFASQGNSCFKLVAGALEIPVDASQ